MRQKPTNSELLRNSRRASDSGTDLLTMGASVGALGLVGAVIGAVCPVCVVVTPALVGLGAVQKVRGALLAAKARKAAETAPVPE